MRNQISRTSKVLSVILLSLCLTLGLIFVINFNNQSTQSNVVNNNLDMQIKHIYNVDNNKSNIYENYNGLILDDYDLANDTQFNIIVAFVNLTDKRWTQSDINKIMLSFNDDVPDNDVYSVYEYMLDQSYGKISMRAGYVVYNYNKSYYQVLNANYTGNEQYTTESSIFESAVIGKSITIDGQNITEFHCRILHFPGDGGEWNGPLWAHAYMGSALIVSPQTLSNRYEAPYTGTYCHELTHVLGVPDLYIYENSITEDPVGSWYLMASTNYFYPQTINAYYKQLLGFVDESYYTDNKSTKIEEITSDGEYLLSPANNDTQTLALKFGEKDTTITVKDNAGFGGALVDKQEDAKEYFMIEYKKKGTANIEEDATIEGEGLIIYRVIESPTMRENGNMYPTNTNGLYQVYVFRPNDIDSANNANVILGSSYGSLDGTGDKKIYYSDGTNFNIVITNKGLDKQGNAIVEIDFLDELFSVSGTLKDSESPISNAKIFISTYSELSGGYTAPVDSGYTTDENGYFFIPNLADKTKISFFVEGMNIESQLTINGNNLINVDVDTQSKYDVTLNFFETVDGTKQALVGVNVYRDGALIATSNENGQVVISLNIGDKLTFELNEYIFSPYEFLDKNQTEVNISGYSSTESFNLKLTLLDDYDDLINFDNINIYDISSDKPNLITYVVVDNYIAFEANVGTKIMITKKGYATKEIVLTSDYFDGSTKEVVLQKYKPFTIKVITINKEGKEVFLPDVVVYVDGTQIGITNQNGEFNLTEIYKGQTITFKHLLYKIDSYEFNGIDVEKKFTAQYKQVKVYLEFYRPQVTGDSTYDPNNSKIAVEELVDELKIIVSGQPAITPQVENGYIYFDAVYFADVLFECTNYAITNFDNIILMQNKTKSASYNYGVFSIDPSSSVSNDGEVITFKLYAKKILKSVKGKISFPENAEAKTVEIYINNKSGDAVETNELGEFELTNILEGDEIIFVCDGFKFGKLYATSDFDSKNLTVKAEKEIEENYLALYIMFGVLAVLFIVPFFIRLKPKNKYLDEI